MPKVKRREWWAITHSRPGKDKTYHTLNVAGKRDRPVTVTMADLSKGRGPPACCLNCVSNLCEHALFVIECVTMGVTTIGEERHRDSAPPPNEPPPDLDQWRNDDDDNETENIADEQTDRSARESDRRAL